LMEWPCGDEIQIYFYTAQHFSWLVAYLNQEETLSEFELTHLEIEFLLNFPLNKASVTLMVSSWVWLLPSKAKLQY
jgi:hypothetical protein